MYIVERKYSITKNLVINSPKLFQIPKYVKYLKTIISLPFSDIISFNVAAKIIKQQLTGNLNFE